MSFCILIQHLLIYDKHCIIQIFEGSFFSNLFIYFLHLNRAKNLQFKNLRRSESKLTGKNCQVYLWNILIILCNVGPGKNSNCKYVILELVFRILEVHTDEVCGILDYSCLYKTAKEFS